jgi:hypothetical protein
MGLLLPIYLIPSIQFNVSPPSQGSITSTIAASGMARSGPSNSQLSC